MSRIWVCPGYGCRDRFRPDDMGARTMTARTPRAPLCAAAALPLIASPTVPATVYQHNSRHTGSRNKILYSEINISPVARGACVLRSLDSFPPAPNRRPTCGVCLFMY